MDPGTRQPELILVLTLMLGPSSKSLLAEKSNKKVGTGLCPRLSEDLKNKNKTTCYLWAKGEVGGNNIQHNFDFGQVTTF